MWIESVEISGYRSIESLILERCGGFNVLIGKNNSGKSNIESGIDAFFSCIESGREVTIEPAIGREIDFHDRNTSNPIRLTMQFVLSSGDREALISDIAAEAPQLRHALDGMNPLLQLAVTITIQPSPKRYSYVSRIALVPPATALKPGVDEVMEILNVGPGPAAELFKQQSTLLQRSKDATGVRASIRELEPAWEVMRGEPSERSRSARRYPLRAFVRSELSPEVFRSLETIYEEATSFDDFAKGAQQLGARLQEQIQVDDLALVNPVTTFAGEQNSIPDYVRNLLSKLAALKVLYLQERRKAIGKEEATRLLDLRLVRGGEEAFENIRETVRGLLGVGIAAFAGGSLAKGTEITAELDVDNFLVQANGAGIREALRLVLDYEFEEPHVLLVEEPEIHLHPALETAMMRYLKRISSDCQIIITTHSTNFLDTAEMRNVYLVSKPDSTRVQLVSLEEAESQIPAELGLRLSSLFMFDKLVFVEGPSDESVLREVAAKMGVNLSQVNVGFVPMGGVRNFSHYATDATLSFLKKRNVEMVFILDRDEKDDQAVARIQETLGTMAQVRVLSKRELENYLVVPRAIAEFIGLKRQLSSADNVGIVPSVEEVVEAIEVSAEQLKEVAIDRRIKNVACRPLYPGAKLVLDGSSDERITQRVSEELEIVMKEIEEAKANLDGIYREQSEYIESRWNSEKLAIVPGDLLLDKVCRAFGVRFRKAVDAERLAGLVTADEIDPEIGEIISHIGN